MSGLSLQEIDQFAMRFAERSAVWPVLEAAGFSRKDLPTWNVATAAEFWHEVSARLAGGAVPDGRWRLSAAALERFPDSAVFAAGAGAAGARVVASWDVARAAWPLPDRFVERPATVEEIRDLLTVTGAGPVGVIGMGGAGKSTIARALLHDDEIRDRFLDGVTWIANSDRDVTTVQTRVLAAFGDLQPVWEVTDGRERLRALLAGRRCLIVLDDVSEAAVVDGFPRIAGVRLLVTSRNRQVLPTATPSAWSARSTSPLPGSYSPPTRSGPFAGSAGTATGVGTVRGAGGGARDLRGAGPGVLGLRRNR